MAAFFELGEEETSPMIDPAGIDRGIVPLDLPDYILNNAYVRVAMRKARMRLYGMGDQRLTGKSSKRCSGTAK